MRRNHPCRTSDTWRQLPSRARPTDAEYDLLADAHVLIPSVQLCRYFTVLRRILGEVRVQQQERYATHLHPVHIDPDRTIPHLEGELDGVSLGILFRPHRQILEVIEKFREKEAVSLDKAKTAEELGLHILTSDWREYHANKAIVETDRADAALMEYIVSAGMLGYIASGKRTEAGLLWEKYGRYVPSDQLRSPSTRLLLAHVYPSRTNASP
jgi:hypothetical protein